MNNFIDYPVTLDAIAGGDLVCWRGSWRKVVEIVFHSNADKEPDRIRLEGSDLWVYASHLPVAHIARPLLEVLGGKDPFQ